MDNSYILMYRFNINAILQVKQRWKFVGVFYKRQHGSESFTEDSHLYVYSGLYVYSFREKFPPVRLFPPVQLFRTLEYI